MNRLPCSLTENGPQEETKQESKNVQVSSGWTLIAYINHINQACTCCGSKDLFKLCITVSQWSGALEGAN